MASALETQQTARDITPKGGIFVHDIPGLGPVDLYIVPGKSVTIVHPRLPDATPRLPLGLYDKALAERDEPVTIPGVTDWDKDVSGADDQEVQEGMYLHARDAYTPINPVSEAFGVGDGLQERIDRLAESAEIGQVIEEARQGVFDVYLNGEAEAETGDAGNVPEAHDARLTEAHALVYSYSGVYFPGLHVRVGHAHNEPGLKQAAADIHTHANGAAPDADHRLLRSTHADFVTRPSGNGTPDITERRGDNDGYHTARDVRHDRFAREEAREQEERYERIGLPKDIEAARAVVPVGMSEGRPVYLTPKEIGDSVAVPESKRKTNRNKKSRNMAQGATQTRIVEPLPTSSSNGAAARENKKQWEDKLPSFPLGNTGASVHYITSR